MSHKVSKILLVEDNEGDIFLTLQALREAEFKTTIDVVTDGEAAVQFLRKLGPYKMATTPDLVLLDINLPKMSGTEVLSEIKTDKHLMLIPVVMLTTSNSEKDIHRAYSNHANCYITKPVDYDKFMEVVHTIKSFWVSTVRLPN